MTETDIEKLLKALNQQGALEGLINAKRAVGRGKDLRLIPELEALREMRKTEKKN